MTLRKYLEARKARIPPVLEAAPCSPWNCSNRNYFAPRVGNCLMRGGPWGIGGGWTNPRGT